jgi:pimeloyl-ACP methyl ester carboxylesterase
MRVISAGRPDSPSDHVTPYDRFAWNDCDVERLLTTGKHERELVAYFGAAEYRLLAKLAKRCERTPLRDGAPLVIVVPGIMGSQLGLRRPSPLPHDVLWLDPIDIGVGRLTALQLPARAPIVPLGVVLFSYLRLKLHLRAGGFAPVFHDYDWRLEVSELGRALAQRIDTAPADRVMIVAHSLGGLVTRAALTEASGDKVARVVLLGTPNFGSFAPLQALRGTYAVVRKIARLVSNGTAEALAGGIFNTFPSLYQMLPVAARTGGADLLDPAQWPRSAPQPDTALLRKARDLQSKLASPDERICCVVGVGQETVTAASRRGDEFVYTVTRHGDGTVPAVSAALPGACNHYTRVAHSELTRDPVVAAAVRDLLRYGRTNRLPSTWQTHSLARATVSDGQLQRMHTDKVDWAGLQPGERRDFLQNLNEPPQLRLRVPGRKSVRGHPPGRKSARRHTSRRKLA